MSATNSAAQTANKVATEGNADSSTETQAIKKKKSSQAQSPAQDPAAGDSKSNPNPSSAKSSDQTEAEVSDQSNANTSSQAEAKVQKKNQSNDKDESAASVDRSEQKAVDQNLRQVIGFSNYLNVTYKLQDLPEEHKKNLQDALINVEDSSYNNDLVKDLDFKVLQSSGLMQLPYSQKTFVAATDGEMTCVATSFAVLLSIYDADNLELTNQDIFKLFWRGKELDRAYREENEVKLDAIFEPQSFIEAVAADQPKYKFAQGDAVMHAIRDSNTWFARFNILQKYLQSAPKIVFLTQSSITVAVLILSKGKGFVYIDTHAGRSSQTAAACPDRLSSLESLPMFQRSFGSVIGFAQTSNDLATWINVDPKKEHRIDCLLLQPTVSEGVIIDHNAEDGQMKYVLTTLPQELMPGGYASRFCQLAIASNVAIHDAQKALGDLILKLYEKKALNLGCPFGRSRKKNHIVRTVFQEVLMALWRSNDSLHSMLRNAWGIDWKIDPTTEEKLDFTNLTSGSKRNVTALLLMTFLRGSQIECPNYDEWLRQAYLRKRGLKQTCFLKVFQNAIKHADAQVATDAKAAEEFQGDLQWVQITPFLDKLLESVNKGHISLTSAQTSIIPDSALHGELLGPATMQVDVETQSEPRRSLRIGNIQSEEVKDSEDKNRRSARVKSGTQAPGKYLLMNKGTSSSVSKARSKSKSKPSGSKLKSKPKSSGSKSKSKSKATPKAKGKSEKKMDMSTDTEPDTDPDSKSISKPASKMSVEELQERDDLYICSTVSHGHQDLRRVTLYWPEFDDYDCCFPEKKLEEDEQDEDEEELEVDEQDEDDEDDEDDEEDEENPEEDEEKHRCTARQFPINKQDGAYFKECYKAMKQAPVGQHREPLVFLTNTAGNPPSDRITTPKLQFTLEYGVLRDGEPVENATAEDLRLACNSHSGFKLKLFEAAGSDLDDDLSGRLHLDLEVRKRVFFICSICI
jgi:hypothetical protein